MDCHVAALLAETEARLCEPFPSLRTATPSLRTATPSLRAPPRLCKRHPVFASAAKQSTPQTARCSTIDCHVATLLAETCFNGLPRRYVPRRDSSASLRTLAPSLRAPPRLCKRHPVIASAAKQSTSQNLSQQPLRLINQQLQMRFINKALGINLIQSLCTTRSRRKPTIFSADLNPTNRRAIAWGIE